MMQRLMTCLLICASLAGCAGNRPSSYGNFTTTMPQEASTRLVADSLKQLSSLYPPARTQLNVQQTAADAFGAGLVGALRAKGYAVLEFEPVPESSFWRTSVPPAPASTTGVSLHYVVDQPGSTDLYRLALKVGDRTLTRAYRAQNNTALPAGAWLRKE